MPKILAPALALGSVYFLIKVTVAPLYWPGGDSLNYLQNAYFLLRTLLGEFGRGLDPYVANAWWQPIGASIYLIATGVTVFNTWYLYLFAQSFLAGLCLVLMFQVSRRRSSAAAILCSAVFAAALLNYLDFPAHNLNLGLQAAAVYMIAGVFEDEGPWSRWRLLPIALVLIALNLVRASGVVLLSSLLVVLVVRWCSRGLPQGYPTAVGVFLTGYCLMNLAGAIVFDFRTAQIDKALAGERECYLDYANRVIAGNYSMPQGIDVETLLKRYQAAGRTDFPFAAFAPEDDLRRLTETVPTYSTFRVARLAEEFCGKEGRRVPSVGKIVKYMVFGDVPPRGGRQLMVTLQMAPTRRLPGVEMPLSVRWGGEIENELWASLPKISNSAFYRTATFAFEHFDSFYRQHLDAYVAAVVSKNPRLDRAMFERERAYALLGLNTIWAGGGSHTVVEGFIYTILGAIAGPTVTDALYRDHFFRTIRECPTCRLLFLENLIFEARNLFFPNVDLFGWYDPGPNTNTKTGLPQGLARELTDTIQNTAPVARLLSMAYYSSFHPIGALGCVVLIGLVIPKTRRILVTDPVAQFLGLVLVAKLLFLGLFAAGGDGARYTDELRLYVLLLFPIVVGAWRSSRAALPPNG